MVRSLLCSCRSVSAVSASNTPAGSVARSLRCSCRLVSEVNGSNTSAGSAISTLSYRVRFLSAVSPANTPEGSVASALSCRYRYLSAVNSSNTPAGSVIRPFSTRRSSLSAVSPSNTPEGSAVSSLLFRYRLVSEVSPAKSPAARAVMLSLFSSNEPVMAARWVPVTSAQALTPSILARMKVCTTVVRPQMPVWARAGVASAASASTQARAVLARAGNRGVDGAASGKHPRVTSIRLQRRLEGENRTGRVQQFRRRGPGDRGQRGGDGGRASGWAAIKRIRIPTTTRSHAAEHDGATQPGDHAMRVTSR